MLQKVAALDVGASRYPVTEEGAVVEELYAFVASNRQEVKQPIDEAWRPYCFAHVPFPRSTLLNSLQREAQAGRRLYRVLGQDFYVELY